MEALTRGFPLSILRGDTVKKLLGLALVLTLCWAPALAQKKRVAVMDFDFGTVQRWWEGNWDIGKGISDMIVDELVNDEARTYSVIERKRLDTILAEQNFSNSNRADPSSAARIGKVLGIGAIITGSVTQFGVEKKGFSLGGIGVGRGGFGVGKIGTQKGKASVKITARIVDVNTAEILASAKGEGKSSRSGLILGGGGGGGGGFGGGGISMTSSDFRQTILGEATEAAVADLAAKLIKHGNRVKATKAVVRGLVADVDGATLILNVGTAAGLKAGDVLTIVRVTRTVKDPATGKVLREITSEVGRVRIDQADEGSSVGTVTSGSDIKVGDVVKN